MSKITDLSKSRYCKGIQCPKMLWLDAYKPEEAEDILPETVLENGTLVGDLARGYFGGYSLMDFSFNKSEMVNKTNEFMQSGAENIAEAAFEHDGLYCAVDILHRNGDGWDIVEVKSSTEIHPVYIEDIPYRDSTNGYFSPTEGKIVVRAGLSEAHTLKTLIHETAHSRLHWDREHDAIKKIPTTQAEIEAESVAYTVCSYYGIDSSDYSFGYVAGWSQKMDTSELMSSMQTIQTAAQEIINTIDAELIRGQEKEACTSLIVIPDHVTERDFGKSGIEAAIERVEKGPVIGPEERSIGR